jgi:WD40 repeat protein
MKKNIILCFLATTWSISIGFAQLNAQEAQQLRKEAKDNKEKVRRMEIETREARIEAERFRYLMLADEIAIRSTEINDKRLAGLLVLQAYNFNAQYKGYKYNSIIYFGLSNAIRNFDRFPKYSTDSTFDKLLTQKKNITVAELRNEKLKIWLLNHGLDQIEFSHSGKILAGKIEGQKMQIWNMENTGQAPILITEENEIASIAFAEDDSQLVCGTKNPNVKGAQTLIRVWPLSISAMANELATFLTVNLTKEEWDEFIGDANYQSTLKNLPPNNK